MDDARALSAAETQLRHADVQFDPHVQTTSGGSRIVHAQQQHRGLSIYPHSIVIEVAADGVITTSGDELLDTGAIDVVPLIGPEEAAAIAYDHLRSGSIEICHAPHEPRFERGRYKPRVVAAFPMPNRPTVIAAGPFAEPVQANLVIFRDTRTLAWLVWMYVDRVADFTIVVGASGDDAHAILYCAAESASAICSGKVYLFNPGEGQPVPMTFPRPLADYPFAPTTAFRDWVDTNQLLGNNVETLLANKTPKLRAIASQAGPPQFIAAVNSEDEQIVNAFFLCNFLHDFFSLAGFGETDGNFQQQNFTGGKGGDRLIVNVVRQAQGEANIRAQNDGTPVELSLGVWNGASGKHTALDADIVIHEFAHGVSQRLVGGKLKKNALTEPQSVALGEGWSDYFAITIQNFYRPAPRFTFAAFASQKVNGVRPTPASAQSYDNLANGFGSLAQTPFQEQHVAGSIFASALIRMQTALITLLGKSNGNETGWRMVVDSLKRVPANPTFLDARDAILKSIPAQLPNVEPLVRRAFADFGMGRNASCKNTSFKNIQADNAA
ncbi:MAG TPA: M36 family metallopeptidase [Thermoanaerobaculia bacterium]|nr:M36 family metallopeptidase [Thermoanaerobaculia bacterium]